MDNIKQLLPVGSVVRLQGAIKRIMIFGIKQTDKTTGKEHDYMGVVYPEGNLGDGSQFFFEHEMIEEVSFRGYEDAEREAFIEKLRQFYETQREPVPEPGADTGTAQGMDALETEES